MGRGGGGCCCRDGGGWRVVVDAAQCAPGGGGGCAVGSARHFCSHGACCNGCAFCAFCVGCSIHRSCIAGGTGGHCPGRARDPRGADPTRQTCGPARARKTCPGGRGHNCTRAVRRVATRSRCRKCARGAAGGSRTCAPSVTDPACRHCQCQCCGPRCCCRGSAHLAGLCHGHCVCPGRPARVGAGSVACFENLGHHLFQQRGGAHGHRQRAGAARGRPCGARLAAGAHRAGAHGVVVSGLPVWAGSLTGRARVFQCHIS